MPIATVPKLTPCKHCGKEFEPKYRTVQRYCSDDCRRQAPKPGQITRACEVCGTAFLAWRQRVQEGGARFCSRTCMGVAFTADGHPVWKGGEEHHKLQLQHWRKANAQHLKEYAKRWREANRDRARQHSQQTWDKHRETYIAQKRARWHALRADPKMRSKLKAERARARRLQRYGLTPDLYDALWAQQNGGCAICAQSLEPSLHVDHDHVTGAVRGLLCNSCNSALGLFRDNTMVLLRAVEYLRTHKERSSNVG